MSQVKALYGALSTGSNQVYFKEQGDVFIEPLESHHTRVTQPVVPHLDGDVSILAGAAVQGGVVALMVLVPEETEFIK